MKNIIKFCNTVFIMLSFLAVVSCSTVRAPERIISDSEITSKLQAEISKDPDLKKVRVRTFSEQVILSGSVSSAAQNEKVLKLANCVLGVKSVKNFLHQSSVPSNSSPMSKPKYLRP